MPLSCLIGGKIFGVHGGLSPAIDQIDQINSLDRFHEVPPEGILLSNYSLLIKEKLLTSQVQRAI